MHTARPIVLHPHDFPATDVPEQDDEAEKHWKKNFVKPIITIVANEAIQGLSWIVDGQKTNENPQW